jgi:hypothetical protein
MGRNNKDFHIPYSIWDGNSSATHYADVRKGISHEEVRYAFLNGHCHGLACQINELGGHPIGKVSYKKPESPEEEGALHYFNYDKNDSKFGYDIGGRRPIADIVSEVGSKSILKHEKISNEQFHQETSNGEYWLPINRAASTVVAKQILGKEE